jgi:hypothetical protein
MRRRPLLKAGGRLAGALAVPGLLTACGSAPPVAVWKSPTCGCCNDWITHLEENGFQVQRHDTGNASARVRLGVPPGLGSCHTAEVAGYALEGHVPAREVRRLLAERPADVIGLAVPGMPLGSPGMDGPAYGGRRDPYEVLLVRKDGSTVPYQSYP